MTVYSNINFVRDMKFNNILFLSISQEMRFNRLKIHFV